MGSTFSRSLPARREGLGRAVGLDRLDYPWFVVRTRGPRVIDDHVRGEMRNILAAIQDGTFAKEWVEENRAGRPNFNALRKAGQDHPVEKVGAKLRAMMPFVSQGHQRLQDVSGG